MFFVVGFFFLGGGGEMRGEKEKDRKETEWGTGWETQERWRGKGRLTVSYTCTDLWERGRERETERNNRGKKDLLSVLPYRGLWLNQSAKLTVSTKVKASDTDLCLPWVSWLHKTLTFACYGDHGFTQHWPLPAMGIMASPNTDLCLPWVSWLHLTLTFACCGYHGFMRHWPLPAMGIMASPNTDLCPQWVYWLHLMLTFACNGYHDST